jgi:molybdopterin-guanine dinucleotide biosynthesis protein A
MGGGDKCLLPLAGRPMLSHVLDVLRPQTRAILINSNSEPELFGRFGVPVAQDTVQGFHGPLAGVLTGLIWARENHGATHMLSVPCDTPFVPADLAGRLEDAIGRHGAEIAIACDEERSHPVIGLWPVALAGKLAADLTDGARAVHRWLAQFHVCEVRFAARHFHNINTRTDLCEAGQQAITTACSKLEGASCI